MPISRSEFDSGEPDPSLLVTEFLRSNHDYAYTMEELLAELALKGVSFTLEEVKSILSFLEKQEKVEVKMMRGMVYYIYRKPSLGFRPS